MSDRTVPTPHRPGAPPLLVGGTATARRAGAVELAALGLPRPATAIRCTPCARAPQLAAAPLGRDTWHSLDAMTDPATGLPADNIPESLAAGDRRGYTSPTNIGGYLWSAIVARELGIITAADCSARLDPHADDAGRDGAPRAERDVLQLVRRGHRRAARSSGPTTATTVEPFVSSVDSGWLGAALLVVKNVGCRRPRPLAAALFDRMRWDAFYNPGDGPGGHPVDRPGGLMHGGFYPFATAGPAASTWAPTSAATTSGSPRTTTTRSSPRRGSRATSASSPARCRRSTTSRRGAPSRRRCDWSWHEMQPVGRDPHLPRDRGLRGRVHLPRHAHRARLGRKHVRGAHARGLRARGGLGAAQLGGQPPAPRAGRARARPRGRGLRLLGLLALEQPRRRLPRVRRRRARDEPRGLLLRPGEDQLRRRVRRLPRRRPTPTRLTGPVSSRRTPRSSR